MKRRIRRQLALLASLLALAGAGCSKSRTPEVSTAATPQPKASQPAISAPPAERIDACTLLTKEDTQAVQGEPFTSTKPSQPSVAGLTVSQCYFELPMAVNSIVVTVTRKADGAGGRDPSQSWQEIFHREHPREKKEEGEEKEPQKVEGIGDEAFWTGNRVGGALYVLKGNSYLRISVGGAGDQAQKLEKSKALADRALKRM
jgi:hypothetical protein